MGFDVIIYSHLENNIDILLLSIVIFIFIVIDYM
jgi:hypothetical protein